MWFIAFFGLLMMVLSVLMIKNPYAWASSIRTFSHKAYFHLFEIISRLIFGLVFIVYAEQTSLPLLIKVIGWIVLLVAIGLAFTPPSKHRQFAVWSSHRFVKSFRIAGVGSLLFGGLIITACFFQVS